MRRINLVFICIFIFNCNLYSQEINQHSNSGFIDFNGYYDTRDFTVTTINILGNLPNRFQYFSLTNYQSLRPSSDQESFYSEQNIRWKIKENNPLDLTLQYVMKQGKENDDLRFGVRWRLNNTTGFESFFKKIHFSYSINPMIVEFHEYDATEFVTQIEHVYRFNIYRNKIYFAGFADQNFVYNNNSISFKWVTEHQLGIRLINELFFVAEFKINDYLPKDNSGLGIGLEYKIVF
jgi:hypothetical protein